MVRFRDKSLIIEIPCEDADAVDYYEDFQKALYELFWLVNSNGGTQYESISWIANYLGPALCVLEPTAKAVLSSTANSSQSKGANCPKAENRSGNNKNVTFSDLRKQYPELSEAALQSLITTIRCNYSPQNESPSLSNPA